MGATRLQFDWEWRTTVAVALLFPLLLSLGFWQLSRADEKREIQREWTARSAAPPVRLESLWEASEDELAFLPVRVVGRVLPEQYFLLDNQSHRRQYGFHVFNVVELEDGRLALLNRGWVVGDPARRSLPQVPPVEGPVNVLASVYVPPGEAYQLAEQTLAEGWPKVLQALEMDKVAATLPGQVYRFSLRIDEADRLALAADWPVVNVGPEKHQGYAVQWFAMAGALLIVFIFASSNLRQWLRAQRRTT